jgi:TolA-binding protein
LPLATKILTIGITASALATGAVMLEQHPSPREALVSSSAPIAREPGASGPSMGASTKEASEVPTAPPVEAPPAAPPPNASENPGTAAPTVQASARPAAAPSASSDDLSEGVSVLELARSAIAEGDTARALRIVNEYERQFPKGDLREEAETIRIEALIARGRDAEALDAASTFLATSPNSPHARHVRAMVASLRASRSNP